MGNAQKSGIRHTWWNVIPDLSNYWAYIEYNHEWYFCQNFQGAHTSLGTKSLQMDLKNE